MQAQTQPIGNTPYNPLLDTKVTPNALALVYWEKRMFRLRYTDAARPGSENELFARIEHDRQTVYFPLDTHLPEKAAARAREIYRTLASSGWSVARRRYIRQIIWAMYWFTEPMACTYATLFSVPGYTADSSKAYAVGSESIPVALVETEPEVLGGLEQCIRRTPGFHCVQRAASAKQLLQRPASHGVRPQLVLFNQHSLDVAADTFQQQLHTRWPGVVTIPFGIFDYSDEIFMSMTDMDRGYFLRRRLPAQILEPLTLYWQAKPAVPAQLRPHLMSYFQKLMVADLSAGSADAVSRVLTPREAQILHYLGLGHTDKTMSSLLNISIWTVHTHIKNIFKKLGVHTRAEAVMRYQQK